MNKYLLLRDNKQSGPYTVPEIIAKGIKPYDLVWLEGKSISWRYPSEIEELKAYAPAVEEQPFDRFYKKPEQIIQPQAVHAEAEHTPYVPKVNAEQPVAEEVLPVKKVYINFPMNSATEKKAAPAQEKEITLQKQVTEEKPSYTEKYSAPGNYTSKSFYDQPAERVSFRDTKSKKNNTTVYYAAAAVVVLVGIITVLLINYRNQQQQLKELNTIVKEIENKKATEAASQNTNVSNTTPPAESSVPKTSETIVNPELLTVNDHNAEPSPADKNSVVTPQPATEKKPQTLDENTPGVVYKERPVSRRTDNTQTEPAARNDPAPVESTTENIYKLVTVKPNNYKTGVLGGISNLQLHLTNNSGRELHKVAIEIKYLGPEKKVVNTQTVYFENVSPGAESTIDVPKSKRGVTINYTITDIKS